MVGPLKNEPISASLHVHVHLFLTQYLVSFAVNGICLNGFVEVRWQCPEFGLGARIKSYLYYNPSLYSPISLNSSVPTLFLYLWLYRVLNIFCPCIPSHVYLCLFISTASLSSTTAGQHLSRHKGSRKKVCLLVVQPLRGRG